MRETLLLLVVLGASTVVCVPSYSLDREMERMIRDAKSSEPSQLQQVNDFIEHSRLVGKPDQKMVKVASGYISAKLLTPLNSSLAETGDEVRAVVTGSRSSSGGPWIEEGAILEGTVDGVQKAMRAQIDGSITIRFYRATCGEKRIELFTSTDTAGGQLTAGPAKPATKKQKIRGVLMTVTKIAVPAAIGTGGMSVAITTGAGAAIGLAFSEKGHRVSGTVRGAWEGAGLTFLDPLVCKGKTVEIPTGTALQLCLNEPIIAPEYKPSVEKKKEFRTEDEEDTSVSLASLQTHAQIISGSNQPRTSEHTKTSLNIVNKKIAQNDLASALVELQKSEDEEPDSVELRNLHTELLGLITGQTK